MRLFIANVAANDQTARSGLRSPVFRDGTFEIVPIPEESGAATPRYGELRSWTRPGSVVADFVPEIHRTRRAHADPDFSTHTYGDVLRYTGGSKLGRSAQLESARAGDQLWFVARLWKDGGNTSSQYFIGFLVLAQAPVVIPWRDAAARVAELASDVRSRIVTNPNYLRLRAGEQEDAILVVGDPATSRRFQHAIEVTREVAGAVYGSDRHDPVLDRYFRGGVELTNKRGTPRTFRTFHSVTRSIQSFLESGSDEACLSRMSLWSREAGQAS